MFSLQWPRCSRLLHPAAPPSSARLAPLPGLPAQPVPAVGGDAVQARAGRRRSRVASGGVRRGQEEEEGRERRRGEDEAARGGGTREGENWGNLERNKSSRRLGAGSVQGHRR